MATDPRNAPPSPAEEDAAFPLSKTKRKRQMEELQALGEALVGLSADQVKRIDIPESLREEVIEAQRLQGGNEALRRQMQYIGRLMRAVDPEPMRAALAQIRGESAGETARLHRLENLRDRLLNDEKTVQEIAERFPGVNMQHLRSLRRAALKEREQNKPPRLYRAIFQRLKALDREAADKAPDADDAAK